MKKLLLLLMITLLAGAGCAWAENTGHGEGHAAHWSYDGDTGPAHWGSMKPEFSACSQGKSQSPINIVDVIDIELPAINFAYQATQIDLVNNGHTVQSNYAPGSSITVAGTRYELLQFHFHAKSENAVDGKRFPLEAHLVHKDAAGSLAVVGVLFDLGEANPALAQFWKNMPYANSVVQTYGTFNVLDLLPENKEYYSWSGSLTTPPCTEGVKWMLLTQPVTVSAKQVKTLEDHLGFFNNRPVQPLNGRDIQR